MLLLCVAVDVVSSNLQNWYKCLFAFVLFLHSPRLQLQFSEHNHSRQKIDDFFRSKRKNYELKILIEIANQINCWEWEKVVLKINTSEHEYTHRIECISTQIHAHTINLPVNGLSTNAHTHTHTSIDQIHISSDTTRREKQTCKKNKR